MFFVLNIISLSKHISTFKRTLSYCLWRGVKGGSRIMLRERVLNRTFRNLIDNTFKVLWRFWRHLVTKERWRNPDQLPPRNTRQWAGPVHFFYSMQFFWFKSARVLFEYILKQMNWFLFWESFMFHHLDLAETDESLWSKKILNKNMHI